MTDCMIQLRWKLYQIKLQRLLSEGFQKGLIHLYDDALLERLREVYLEGLPLSLLIMCPNICGGRCYQMRDLITLGFSSDDDYKTVDAKINNLRFNPENIRKFRNHDYSERFTCHGFVERTMADGSTWVYDTSYGLVFEKSIYYELENPVIVKEGTKVELASFQYEKRNEEVVEESSSLLLLIEYLEVLGNRYYEDKLKKEIQIFKEKQRIHL